MDQGESGEFGGRKRKAGAGSEQPTADKLTSDRRKLTDHELTGGWLISFPMDWIAILTPSIYAKMFPMSRVI